MKPENFEKKKEVIIDENKQDFQVPQRKVYSQNFSIEKETLKKKSSVVSWILSFFLIILSISAATGYYFYQKDSVIKEQFPDVMEKPSAAYVLNSNLDKRNPTILALSKKFDLPITAKSYGVYELSTGKTIAESNADKQQQFASITKILTVSTMESLFDSNSIFTINPVGVNILGSRADLKAGEKFNFNDAIYGMMLPSGNDIAISVAMQYGYEDFITKMNNVAAALELKNTKISNPIGFDDLGNHYSSVKDIFTMSRFYLQNEQRDLNKKVAQTTQYDIKGSSGEIYTVKNTNDLLKQAEVYGLKTGTEDIAGQCLVLYEKVNGREYITIILGSTDRFKEGQSILDWLKVNG